MKLRIHSLQTAAALLAALLMAPTTFAGEPGPKVAGDHERHVDRHMMFIGSGDGSKMFEVPIGRGYLGLFTNWLTPELRTHFGAPEDAGVLVAQVTPGSPAAKAGLEVGDVIVAINGENVTAAGNLMMEVRKLEAGDEARIDIVRDRRSQTLTAIIEERERQKIDLGEMMYWKSPGGGPEMMMPRMHGDLLKSLHGVPADAFVNLGDSLKAIDWESVAERAGRSTEDLEKRLADLEKRLAELQKRLEQATRDNR